MEAELAQLAESGATTLTGLMVTGNWARAKERVGAFFARVETRSHALVGAVAAAGVVPGTGTAAPSGVQSDAPDPERVLAAAERRRLEETRTELLEARLAGDAELEEELRDGWRLRLRRILRADPAAAAELRALLREIDPDASLGVPRVRTGVGAGVLGAVVAAGPGAGAVVGGVRVGGGIGP